MSHVRQVMRRTWLALGCALLGALSIATASAVASPFGGLGQVASPKAGEGGANGEVNPRSARDFAVDPKTGDIFIADEFFKPAEEKTEDRLQQFGPEGKFIAESRVKTTSGTEVGGVAVDSSAHKVYLLINSTREEESEATLKKIESKETAIAAKEAQIKKREEKHEPVEELKAEVKKLEEEIQKLEEELPVFDPGELAAGKITSFSTEALKEPKIFASSELLKTESEEPKGALLFPGGIAVDPENHDVVLVGQQDESPTKGPGEEDFRAAVERIHADGKPGPRYVDTTNCLEGEPEGPEPACATKPFVENVRSPIVTPTGGPAGTVDVELKQGAGEVWELPATEEAAASEFKRISVQPRRKFTLEDPTNELQKLVTFGGEEGVANTMSFVPLSSTEGRIYVTANVEGNLSGVLVLNYVLEGGVAKVSERGWTGGQGLTSEQKKCIIPAGSRPPLVAATGAEKVLVLDTSPANEKFSALVAVFGFGPGGEGCGKVSITPPAVEFGEKKNATEVPAGAPTTLRSTVAGANAEGTSWAFKATTKGGLVEEGPFATGYQFEAISFEHAFMHVGEYTILANVATDNLGTPEVKTETHLKVTLGPLSLKIAHPASAKKGEKVAFTATVTDPNSSAPHLTYKWNFGDGTPEATEEESAASSTATRKVEHAFSTNCGTGTCTVTLTVTDGEGAKSPTQAAPVKIEEPSSGGGGGAGGGVTTPPPASGGGGGGVLPVSVTHNPRATLAGTSLSVTKNGSFPVKVTCPAGQSICIGTITLRTLSAVSAKKSKKAILTLASGSFSVSGGQVKTLTLHLSAKAKKLLAKAHSLRAAAVLVAHDSSGATRTTSATVTLRLVKKKH